MVVQLLESPLLVRPEDSWEVEAVIGSTLREVNYYLHPFVIDSVVRVGVRCRLNWRQFRVELLWNLEEEHDPLGLVNVADELL